MARLEPPPEPSRGTSGSCTAEVPLQAIEHQGPLDTSVQDMGVPDITGVSTTPLGATTVGADALSERSRPSVAGSGTRPAESLMGRSGVTDRPLPGDTRELAPALGTVTASTEGLLIQAL